MTEKIFLDKFKSEVLDTDSEISLEMKLSDLEDWDSLSFVSFIAMAKELGFSNVNRDSIKNSKTVADLFELLK